MRRVIIPLAFCFPAVAMSEMPRFDVEGYCEKIAGFGGTYSAEMYNFCVESEQASYNDLKSRWDNFPAAAQEHCRKIASFGSPGSYEMLKFCIEEETRAATQKKTFSY
ncbi:MAG: hypothetical protein Q4G25_16415 [Paracoccus sp. (in: a-proteobacteria)]|nr:hypothetical protein [Paracoccus sp. (in: a-proteobacteria)]